MIIKNLPIIGDRKFEAFSYLLDNKEKYNIEDIMGFSEINGVFTIHVILRYKQKDKLDLFLKDFDLILV